MTNNDKLYILILIILGLIYIILGFVILQQDYNIWDNCQKTDLWYYVLTSILLLSTIIWIDNYYIIKYIFIGLEFILIIWGGIELFLKNTNCPELINTNLYIYGIITFISHFIIICSFIIYNKYANIKQQVIPVSNNI